MDVLVLSCVVFIGIRGTDEGEYSVNLIQLEYIMKGPIPLDRDMSKLLWLQNFGWFGRSLASQSLYSSGDQALKFNTNEIELKGLTEHAKLPLWPQDLGLYEEAQTDMI